MGERALPEEFVDVLRALIAEIERHGQDYHHRTPRGVLEAARQVLRRLEALSQGDSA
jgi:hypothetical protein